MVLGFEVQTHELFVALGNRYNSMHVSSIWEVVLYLGWYIYMHPVLILLIILIAYLTLLSFS